MTPFTPIDFSHDTQKLTSENIYNVQENRLDITIEAVETRLDDHGKQVTFYKITCSTTLPGFTPKSEVERRYSDFETFQSQLRSCAQQAEIPDLPGKHYNLFGSQFTNKAIEERREGLAKFLNEVTKHPQLMSSDTRSHVKRFLQSQSWNVDRGGVLVNDS